MHFGVILLTRACVTPFDQQSVSQGIYQMPELNQTVLEAINHLLRTHPELANTVEQLAAQAQGKSPADIYNYAEWKRYQGMSLQEIFSSIYREGRWGRSGRADWQYFSGSGSHDPQIFGRYVDALGAFVQRLGGRPDAVDLGCGDFNVGSQVRGLFGHYTACDIVPEVIAANALRFADLNVDFRCLDLTRDALPSADVIMIRQVLQHLSNPDIKAFVRAVAGKCRTLIVTEHWPAAAQFPPNLDKPNGADIRLSIGSGVVLTEAPFNLAPLATEHLCSVPETNGQIVTVAYTLN